MPKPVGSAFALRELATPAANPTSGTRWLYLKSDGKLYTKNSAGVETEVGGGAGAAYVVPESTGQPGSDNGDGSLWYDTDDTSGTVSLPEFTVLAADLTVTDTVNYVNVISLALAANSTYRFFVGVYLPPPSGGQALYYPKMVVSAGASIRYSNISTAATYDETSNMPYISYSSQSILNLSGVVKTGAAAGQISFASKYWQGGPNVFGKDFTFLKVERMV